MRSFKKLLRWPVLILLIVLASIGIGIGGAIPIPVNRKKEFDSRAKIEQVDEKERL